VTLLRWTLNLLYHQFEDRLAILAILHATTKSPVLHSERARQCSFTLVPSPLVKRRLGPRPLLPKALNDLFDSGDIELFLSEFVPSHGAQF